jgi:hypothetical protein
MGANFLLQFFVLLFSSTIYIRFFDILAAQNKNHFYNRLILKEVINLKRNLFLGPQAKMLAGGKFCPVFVFA